MYACCEPQSVYTTRRGSFDVWCVAVPAFAVAWLSRWSRNNLLTEWQGVCHGIFLVQVVTVQQVLLGWLESVLRWLLCTRLAELSRGSMLLVMAATCSERREKAVDCVDHRNNL